MNTNITIRRFLALFLSLCLLMPGAALAGGKSGKKNFKEGQKYEAAQQWDLAAQQYALAVAAEQDNPEYRLHYLRALQQASLMYIKRGDALAEQGDYSSAYSAYRTAYQYDAGNESARIKMERMLDQQKAQMSGHEPLNTTTTGNVRPTADIQFANKPRSRDVVQNISFNRGAKFKNVMLTLGRQLGLNVVFDDTVKDDPVEIELTDVSLAKAFDAILLMKKNTFEQIDRRTIIIYPDNATNKPRYEKLMIKTFYTGNITAQQARTVVQGLIGPNRPMATLDGAGGGGPGGSSSNSNTLIVKATAQELQLVQEILESIDKNKNEVVIDVEIYEVSHDSLFQIGNQVAREGSQIRTLEYVDKVTGQPVYRTSPTTSLGNLGGFGTKDILPQATNIGKLAAGFTFNSLAGVSGAGFLLGLPPTSLSLLQSKGHSKLLHKTQIHVLDGGQNTTKVGRSVPVKLGTSYGAGYGGGLSGGVIPGQGGTGNPLAGGINNALLGGGFGYPGVDSIQYRDVGLVIKTKPLITNEGYVEIQMEFETSDVQAGGSDERLTPTFTQRSLNTTARIKDGVTAVVAGVNQDSRGDSRASIPILGMVPILGRLFTTPRQTSQQSDIVITVTPHIVRSAGIDAKDHLAKDAGVMPQGGGSGLAPKIEDVLYRAQQEEEQERRLIAGNAPPPASVPLVPDAQVTSNQLGQPANQPGAVPAPNRGQQVVNTSNTNPNAGVPPRSLNNTQLVNTNYSSTPAPSRPAMPEQVYPQPQPPQGSESDGTPKSSGEQNPELEKAVKEFEAQVNNPENPVPIAAPTASQPSEAYLRKMAEWRRSGGQTGTGVELGRNPKVESAPAELPKEEMGPPQKVSQALPMATNTRGSGAVIFNLSPRPIRQQLGKSFTVTVEINSQAQMTGADVALKFDATKLQVKSVRDGGLLGAQPELTYDLKEKGTVVVRINNARKAPVAASGQLIVIEFTALAEGQSQIALNTGETKVKMPGNINATVGSASTHVTISRDAVTSATNEK